MNKSIAQMTLQKGGGFAELESKKLTGRWSQTLATLRRTNNWRDQKSFAQN